ncbi:apolipoprotein B-100 [Erinaceus europaeus]|uniref:Apolipoprotein B-100 n=3 Tax=Erinaceus TaxID=9364 RepID=A0A1S2ZBH9_ERIEU|nr:apolipoprotein B-100 [Erinaceus europaeus]
MGAPRLLLLLLLLSGAWAQDGVQGKTSPSCPKDATRFKHFRKYVYSYEAEGTSELPGTADSRSSTKIHCKVELEVPQLCSFILRLSQCTLKEVSGFSAEGRALLKKTKNSEEFAAAMSRHELRLAFPGGKQVVLYPEKDEPKQILNIKRGIISALLVPPETEEARQVLFLDTVYGNCSSDVTVKARKGTVATEMAIERDLERCEGFRPLSTGVSPLAFIQGLSHPLSTLTDSHQACQYTLDPKRKHVSEARCQEQHLFLPFSYRNKYGVKTQVTQTLTLEDTPKLNSRFFDEGGEEASLAFESTKSTSPPKQAEAALSTLQELQKLSEESRRAGLFSRLVTELRSLDSEAITSLLPRLMEESSPITLQALIQCGQPHCYTYILRWLQREKANPLLIDIVTYLMALIPGSSSERLQEIFNTAKEQRSRATLYALSHAVNQYPGTSLPTASVELQDIANFLLEQIRDDCTGPEDHTYLILRVIGNMGRTLGQVSPRLTSSILKCIRSTEPSLLVQKAAVQALRKMELTDEIRKVLLQTFLHEAAPTEKRLAAYLVLMSGPSQSDISTVTQLLPREQNQQVKNFVASHMANILNSEDLYVQDLKTVVEGALKESQLPTLMDFTKFSRNYQLSKSVSLASLDPFSGKIEGNLIFDPNSYLPKESMLKTTLTVLGLAPLDLIEIGLEGKGFEPTLEALFGKQGFFPNSVNKALYWVDGQVPDDISSVLMDHFGYTKDDKREQDMAKGIMFSIQNLLKDLKSKEFPEARAYLQVLGEELGFVRLQDLKLLGRLLMNGVQSLRGIPQMIEDVLKRGSKNGLFLHYIFMDNAFQLPTGLGLPVHVSSSGILTPGLKAGLKLELLNMDMELVAQPSVSVEFVTTMGLVIPDFARSGVQMNTNFFHETGLEARMTLKNRQLKFTLPLPKKPIKLFSFSNTIHLVTTSRTEVIPSLVFDRQSWSTCRPFLPGLNYCIMSDYSNATSTDSGFYSPLLGETRFVLELRPTGAVRQYSASAAYDILREGEALVDTLKFVTQAEDLQGTTMTMAFRYNRQRKVFSTELQVPPLDVDLSTVLRVSDESAEGKKSYKLTLDIQNKKITEVTLTGHISCDGKKGGKIRGVISIPRLQAEARSEIHTVWSPTKLLLHMDSSATAYGSTISKKVAWHYDEEKMEFEWNTGTNVNTKKVASNLPLDLSSYPKRLHEYTSSLLDNRIPQTDMTFRHMGSKLVAATNTWLQHVYRNFPSTEKVQDHLSGLKELYLQEMRIPEFHMPENLFLKSDGRVKYILNKNSLKIEIPLPFGGKSSKDLKMWDTVRTPALNFRSVGISLPSREFQMPTFTIPKLYELHVPLLGMLDVSTNVYSNLYNWSALYTGGNSSKDHLSLQALYQVKADSVVDLLSYHVQGSGETTYDHRNTFTVSCDGILHHKLLNSNLKFSHVAKTGNNPASKGLLTFDASSPWGPQMSASVHLDSRKKQHLYVKEVRMDGQFKVSSFYSNGVYSLSYQRDPMIGQLHGESSLRFNSSYIQGTNQVTGMYEDGTFSLISASDLQDGLLKNTASLKYENAKLTLNSDTSGQYEDFVTSSKVDLSFSKHSALLRSEYQADYRSLRLFSLMSGSLTAQGLELNADMLGTDKVNSGAHKATLKIGRDGISTSATSNLKFSPLVLENELNAALDLSGLLMRLTSNGRYREHNAKFSLDGKAALTELSVGSAYQATILGADSKNVFNFKLNQDGLKLSNDLLGSYAEMKFDYTNNLNIAGLSLDFSSKLDSIYSSDKFYKQLLSLQLQPYFLVTTLNNDLKFNALGLTNHGKLRLEPLKLNVGGSVKGVYQDDEIKHVYTVSYADISASYKADTVARVQGAELNHRLNTEIAGLATAIDMSTNYNSDSLHFGNVFHAAVAPFTVTVDAHTNGNGKLILWGDHTGQLYNKFLLKAEPLTFTLTHDYRGSTNHHLKSKRSLSTALNHKANVLLTPAEQTGSWKIKTQWNKNEYYQDFDAYNTKDKVGVEFSGRALADLTMLDGPISLPFLSSKPINVIDAFEMRETIDQPQEFAVAASVKYDKTQDVHTINLPFLKLLPEYFEKNRALVITALEAIQKELKHVNIDQFMRKYRAALDGFPQQLNDYLDASNWERQVASAKEKLKAFTKNYKITENDLKMALDNAKINLNEKLSQLQTYVIQFDQYIKDSNDLNYVKIVITKIIERIIEKLQILDEHANLVKALQDLSLLIEKIDFHRINSRIASWVENMDNNYQIRIQIQEKLQQIKTQIEIIDTQHLAGKLKQQLETFDVKVLWDQLRATIPFQKIKEIIEHVEYRVISLIEGLKVTEKVNTFIVIIHKLIELYEIDQHTQVLVDKLVQLANQYKLKETVEKISNALRHVEMKVHFEKLLSLIDDATKKLKTLSFETFIEEVNRFLNMLVKKLRSFDYHQFVDTTNNKIHEVTRRINSEIQALELPQKAKALKLFVDSIKVMVSDIWEKVKNIKITLFFDWLQDPLSSASLTYMREKFLGTLEDIRDRLYQMDTQREIERYLSLLGHIYSTLVTYVSDWWILAAKNLTDFADQYSIQDWAKKMKVLVEQGFTVPEIRTSFGTIPAFEVSLHALQAATYQTPDFIVPLTDLRIPSIQINFKKLRDIKVPSKFSTPEFTVLNVFHIPSFTIDLIEIKAKIIRTIDQMLSSELQWPVPEIYLRDMMQVDDVLAGITLPDVHFPEIMVPEFVIPNLDLTDFQLPDLHIPEFQLPRVSHTIQVPTFGKLYSTLEIQSPLFTFNANADIKNVTTPSSNVEMVASIVAKGVSKVEALNFHFQANAQLLSPKVDPLVLKESLRFTHKYLNTEHSSEVLFFGNAVEGKSSTVADLHTDKNALEFSNGVFLKINSQLTLDSNTKYSHKLNIPTFDFSSQADLRNDIKTLLEVGHVTLSSSGTGSWKWAHPKYSDEGTHESQINFAMEGPITSFELTNKVNSKHLKLNQNVGFKSGFLNFSKFEIQSQVESQYLGHSILTVKGIALLGEKKAEITGSHNAYLSGKVSGTLKNSLFFLIQPFEITASSNNEGNLKVVFPLKLTGKIDFLNNYALLLSPSAQQASWQAGARFNQYKYSHNFSAGNNENSMEAHVGMNGEANLDFLNIPLTIPEMALPFTTLTTPQVKEFSLWEEAGLKKVLKTTKQSFDLNVKIQYMKNKNQHSISVPLESVYVFIHRNINDFMGKFEKARDKTLGFLAKSYNEARFKFNKSLNEQPRTFQIPGYTIPVINLEASPFTVEMLPFDYMIPKEIITPNFTIPGSDFSVSSYNLALPFLELPDLQIPGYLPQFSLPEFKAMSFPVPALGNITCDFSFKSSLITLNTNAGLYNQSDLVAHFVSSSSSVFSALQYKLEGTSSLTRKRGLKVATALSLNNKFVEGKHDSTISLTKKNMEASVTTVAKVHTPVLRISFKQQLNGNTKSNPTILSSVDFEYDFNFHRVYTTATGEVNHKLSLESLTSYLAIESSTKGDIKVLVLSQQYSGNIANEASIYLNSKGTRASVKLQGASRIDGLWNLEVKENIASEATLQRTYAIWEHSTENHLQLTDLLITSGEHRSNATLELSPGKMIALVQVHASQLSPWLDIRRFVQEVSLSATTENQKVIWKGEVQVPSGSLQNNVQLSNDQGEACVDIAGSLEGHLSFLRDIFLPVYDKNLWDLLKLDVTTSIDRKQYLQASTALVYTKNPKGHLVSIPVQELVSRFIINKYLSASPFVLDIPIFPKMIFSHAEVLTKYSEAEGSSVPFFEIFVPESQLTVSQITLPKRISVGNSVWDLNEVAREIAEFEWPTTVMPEQTIEIPSMKFSLPTGILVPSFGTLTAHFGLTSPLYNSTWSAGLKNKADHVETFLESTCSSTIQFLEYELNVMGTHKFENGAMVCKTRGTFAHPDFSAEYQEDGRYDKLWDWRGESRLDILSPTFTDIHLHYQADENTLSSLVVSPALGTVAMQLEDKDSIFKVNVYYRPESSPDKTLTIIKLEDFETSKDFKIEVSWEEASELLNSLKDKVPKATEALSNYVNKYHQEYTGLNLRDASLKLRRSLRTSAERVYQGAKWQIDEVQSSIQRTVRETKRNYQQWQDKAQNLYQELLAQEGGVNFQRFQTQVFDGLIGVTRESNKTVTHLIDSFVEFLRFNKLRLPGRIGVYTGDELCNMVLREVGKVLLQVHSAILDGLEMVVSYSQDLIENSELIKYLQIKFALKSHGVIDPLLEWVDPLNLFALSEIIKQPLNDLLFINTTETLHDLQEFFQFIFQDVEIRLLYVREKKLSYLINASLQEISILFRQYALYAFEFLRENIYLTFGRLNELIHIRLQEVSQQLQIIKDNCKESLDQYMVTWTVKYYELEEKIISLIKVVIDVLMDFHTKYSDSASGLTSHLLSQVEQFVQKDIQEYLGINPC